MHVEFNLFTLQWFDYTTCTGLIIIYVTIRLILHTCCTDWKFGLQRRLRSALWEAKDSATTEESSNGDGWFQFPLDTSIVMLLTCLLGATNEVRHNGIQLVYLMAAHALAYLIVVEMLMPTLCEQKIAGVPEYLGLRFNKSVRKIAAVLLIFHLLVQLSLAMCIPALTFTQVTGFPIWISLLIVGTLGLAYTGATGLRIGFFTNTIEVLILYGALITILVFGVNNAGGVQSFWNRIREAKLLNFHNFLSRSGDDYDLCSLFIGGIGIMVSLVTATPTQMEQFALSSSHRYARIKTYVCMALCWPVIIAMFGFGLLACTILNGCDPWFAGLVTHRDQLLAFSTSVLFDKMIVIKGWLFACLMLGGFCACATNLNSLAAVVLRDLCGKRVVYGRSQTGFHRTVDWISRWVAILVGIVSMPLAFGLLKSPAGLLKLSLATAGLFGGPLFATMTCGMYMPFVNSVGAMVGLFTSPFVGAGLLIYNIHFGATFPREFSLNSYVSCVNYSLRSLPMTSETFQRTGFNLSYLYIGSTCILFSLIVTMVFSMVTGCNRSRPANRTYMRFKSPWDEFASEQTLNSAGMSDQTNDGSWTLGDTEDIPTQSTYPRR